MKIEVSNGELIDKLTILEIKLNKIFDKDKLTNLMNEWEYINSQTISLYQIFGTKIMELTDQLESTNKELWWVEDQLRLCEKEQRFDKEFVELARSVYKLNDQRSEVKRQINILTKSNFVEEKSYSK